MPHGRKQMATNNIYNTLGNITLDDYYIDSGSIDMNTLSISPTYSIDNIWTSASGTIGLSDSSDHSGKITLKGESADVDINGISLKEFMQRVEKRLALLQVNPHLESEWEELKALGDQYRQLEQHIKDKMKTWDILNRE